MARVNLKDTHLLLDTATRGQLHDIASWSSEGSGMGKTVRSMTRKYHRLISRQIKAEEAGRAVLLVEVDSEGKEVQREKLDMKL